MGDTGDTGDTGKKFRILLVSLVSPVSPTSCERMRDRSKPALQEIFISVRAGLL